MSLISILSYLLFVGSSIAGLQCHDIYPTFSVSTTNRVANNPPHDLFSDPDAVTAFFSQPIAYTNVSGTFKTHIQVCRPQKPSRPPKIQMLVHGASYNHTYWNALQHPNSPRFKDLSWIRRATSLGHWTFAIDRLGNGLSSHPDPVTLAQDALETQVLYSIATSLRHTLLPHDGKLIYVSHSYGSGIGVRLAYGWPELFDAMVLTGIATVRGNPGPGSTNNRWAPASEAFPDRFSGLAKGYLTSTNKTGRRMNFWGASKDFDPAIYDDDFAGEGTTSLGEQLCVAEYLLKTPTNYSRPLFISTGDQDAIFCSDFGGRDQGPVRCNGTGPDSEIGKTRAWFPKVPEKDFVKYLQPDAGHCHLLHKTGGLLLDRAFGWLEGIGL